MSDRSIRRAAERKAMKEARRAERIAAAAQPFATFEDEQQSRDREEAVSPARLAANRANAQLSTGPTSESGKARSALNAVKTGLTGRTVLLPTDDADAYQAHVNRFVDKWQPENDEQSELVQSLADTDWRLLRIPTLETGIYALGHIQFAGQFADQDPSLQPALIQAQTYLTYQRQLNNLSIQENRLRRQRDKDTAKLRELQGLDKRKEVREANQARLDEAARQYIQAFNEGNAVEFALQSNGFEFSIDKIALRAEELDPESFRAQGVISERRYENLMAKKNANQAA